MRKNLLLSILAIFLFFNNANAQVGATAGNSYYLGFWPTYYDFGLDLGITSEFDKTNFDNPSSDDLDGKIQVYDPLEDLNRAIFSFNQFLDDYFVRPVTIGYRYVVPEEVRFTFRRFLRNLTEPITLANALLQGDIDYACVTMSRFMTNTILGVGGLFEVYEEEEYRSEDFGQTLGTYGFGTGPYLMLPIIGPSNLRDGLGGIVDIFTDPLNYELKESTTYIRRGASALDSREAILNLTDDIYDESFDPYASFRSLYLQYRRNQIVNE